MARIEHSTLVISREVSDSDSAGVCERHKSPPPALPRRAVFVLLCATLTFSSALRAQQGMFVPTGSMPGQVYFHTATLLKNGQVLVAGGSAVGQGYGSGLAGQAVASAALYDPTMGTFTATGNMTIARIGHTATLLNNGQVLVAGGGQYKNTAFPLASAELYDPATRTFTPTGSMNTARVDHTATLLNNGMVLVAGGSNGSSALASAELYDPATGTFTATGSMTTARTVQTATLLNDGRVLVAGGSNGSSVLASAELYNPTTGTFAATGDMASAPTGQTATLLNNGKVLVAGGGVGPPLVPPSTVLAGAELYDPAAGTFTATGSMATARTGHSATLLNNGQVLVAGGEVVFLFGGTPVLVSGNSAELYDPTTGTFAATASVTTSRFGHSATLLNNGIVIVAGGEVISADIIFGQALASAELYSPFVVFPTSLSFLNQPSGTTSASQAVTLTNNESTAVTIASISINGANASDFAETNNCVGNLSAGASCSINVTFTPAGTGTFVAGLAIASNLFPSSIPVSLSGAGVAVTRIAILSSSSVTFSGVVLGATGTAQSVTLSNTGNTVLTVSAVGITGTNGPDFAEMDTCDGSLAAGASCTINLTFTPAATGTRNGTLIITDNATSPQSPQTVTLSGTGQDFSMATATPTATVAAGQTVTYSVSVSPAGGFNQTVSLNCTAAPSLSTCTILPNLITLNGTSATSVTVTVATTGPALILPEFPKMGPPRMVNFFRTVLLLSLFLSLILLTRLIRDRRETQRSLAPLFSLVLVVVLAGITLVACGGGGSAPRTPPGTYSLTVSGTFNFGSTTLAHNAKLTLVVQ